MTSAEGLRVPGSDMMGLGSRFVFDCRVWGVRRQVPLSGCVECSGFSIPSGSLRPYRTTMAEWNLGQITIVSGRRYDLSSVPENRGDRLGFLHLQNAEKDGALCACTLLESLGQWNRAWRLERDIFPSYSDRNTAILNRASWAPST